MNILLLLQAFILYRGAEGVSMRKIFTLFTTEKTWNEASAICRSQFGQLAKIEDEGDLSEINVLDNKRWSNHVHNASFIWIGLHQPFINTTWEYQDCEIISPNVSFVSAVGGKCAAIDGLNQIWAKNCSMTAIFVCERYEGDCWFEPHVEQFYATVPYHVQTLSPATLAANDCAMQCRNQTYLGTECWGFFYDLQNIFPCELYFLDGSNASTIYPAGTPIHNSLQPDTVFYVRKCFEDAFDTKAYAAYIDTSSEPTSDCNTTVYPGDEPAMNVCFCSTEDQPTIPEPITAEEKAAKLVEELKIETSNTSSATRKLISAEDNRPSAVGVGFLGVGLLTAVFGGLFLMDLNVLIAGLKNLICSKGSATSASDF
ncbi:Klrk1p [Mactra antiquata]